MAVHITTVGTSLLTNLDDAPDQPVRPWAGWRFGAELPSEQDAAAFLQGADPRQASAETHTLHAVPMLEGDRLTLLHSDTPEGDWCARVLAAHYRRRGHAVEVRRLAGIGYDAGPFAERGLKALVSAAFDEIRHARDREEAVTLCATGGFKAETAMMTLVGLLAGARVVYIHERFRSMVEIPPLPVNWDSSFVERNAAFFAWIDEEPRSIGEVRQRLRGAEQGLAALVDEHDDGCAYLSPAGELLHKAFRERSSAGPAPVWPEASPRLPEEKDSVSSVEHHRPDGWRRVVDSLTRLGCVEHVRFDGSGDRSARESGVASRDARTGILRVVYVAGDRALPLVVETTARDETGLQLVESYVTRVLRSRR